MFNHKTNILPALLALMAAGTATAQTEDEKEPAGRLNRSIQSDGVIPRSDSKIGTEDYSVWGVTKTFAELNLTSK